MTAVPARLSVDTELRHGYTLAQVRALSITAVRRDSFYQAADFDERLEVAWHAIVEHIYTAPRPPPAREVIQAGWRAIGDHVDRGLRFYGRDTHDRYAGSMAGFERYWWAARVSSGPEEPVTERVALGQIWPLLRPVHRQVLAALAACDDYGAAAAALGKSRKSFTTQVGQARRAFLELWHQGESPSRPWGADRRLNSADRHTVTNRTIVRRQRRAARLAASNGGQLPPPARRGGRAYSDLGISGAELVRRYEQGESARQLAASLGRSYSVIHRRLHTEGAQLRPGGRPARKADG